MLIGHPNLLWLLRRRMTAQKFFQPNAFYQDRKLADILLPSCLDVSIVFLFALSPAVAGVGEAARKAEERKIEKYERECYSNGLLFRPFVIESTGGFGHRAEEVLSRLAVELASVRRVEPAEALAAIRQQLVFTAQKAMVDRFLMHNNA